jgi:hypothetical protein
MACRGTALLFTFTFKHALYAALALTCGCPGDETQSEVGPSLLAPLGLMWLLLGGLGPMGAKTGRGCGERLMGRTLGGKPMGPLPGSVDSSGVWNSAAMKQELLQRTNPPTILVPT